MALARPALKLRIPRQDRSAGRCLNDFAKYIPVLILGATGDEDVEDWLVQSTRIFTHRANWRGMHLRVPSIDRDVVVV